jgi:predicted phage terminase large subunit-like protein
LQTKPQRNLPRKPTEQEWKVLEETLKINRNFNPHVPNKQQAWFLALSEQEILYGGAAGGGKTDALLIAALQYAHVPNYAAIIFRRSYTDLELPDALVPRSKEWLTGKAKWRGDKYSWEFPNGATLTFGYMSSENDKYRYQGAQFQFIGFDELTQFSETQYRYLFSRLRRLEESYVPLRMRGASNPGGIGHEWVKQRFITEGSKEGRLFIPASLWDNPYLDREEYVNSLSQLDPITRAQLLEGDWTAREAGSIFRREWFQYVSKPPNGMLGCRFWDLAATLPKIGIDPDYTCGVLTGRKDGIYYICDVQRFRDTPANMEKRIRQTAIVDRQRPEFKDVETRIEEEKGSSGILLASHYSRNVLNGFNFRSHKNTGDKEVRANPPSAAAEMGNMVCVNGIWLTDFLDELESFPNGSHDDQVDGLSGSFAVLSEIPDTPIQVSFGRRPS